MSLQVFPQLKAATALACVHVKVTFCIIIIQGQGRYKLSFCLISRYVPLYMLSLAFSHISMCQCKTQEKKSFFMSVFYVLFDI